MYSENSIPHVALWIALLTVLILGACHDTPDGEGTTSEEIVQQQIEDLLAYLDSPEYEAKVTWEEHVVLCYRLAQDRDPTDLEFVFLEDLRTDPGIRRSQVLALVLGTDEQEVTWETASRFLALHEGDDFEADETVSAQALRMNRSSRSNVARMLERATDTTNRAVAHRDAGEHRHISSAAGVAYQTYFGFLHAHSHLSDGEGGALEAYEFARDSGELDFFSLTDHGINLFVRWPWQNKWSQLKEAAEATHDPGEYVTFWGFEWSNPLLGHVSIINTDDYTHTLACPRMSDLYEWITDRPQAFARFNHPGRFGGDILQLEVRELHHLDLEPSAIPQMVGLELWNKDDGFDVYYYENSWNQNPLSYLDVGIQKGWQLGSLGGQDNHKKEWGTRNEFRTAVLAEELTREALMDAYLKRRIYATEDKDLFLDVRASGFPMGSRLSGVSPTFEVTARDGGGDSFEQVRLFRNGVELEARPVSGTEIAVSFTDPAPTGTDYYYFIVTQGDDGDGNGRNDEAISSPIWIDG